MVNFRNSVTGMMRSTLGSPFHQAVNDSPESTAYRVILPWDEQANTFSVIALNARQDLHLRVPLQDFQRLLDKISTSEFTNLLKGLEKPLLIVLGITIAFMVFASLIFIFIRSTIFGDQNNFWYLVIFLAIVFISFGVYMVMVYKFLIKKRKMNLKLREKDFQGIVDEFAETVFKDSGVSFKVGKYGAFLCLNLNFMWDGNQPTELMLEGDDLGPGRGEGGEESERLQGELIKLETSQPQGGDGGGALEGASEPLLPSEDVRADEEEN